VRNAVARKAESRLIDAESEHRVDLRKHQLRFDIADSELGRKQVQTNLERDDGLRIAERRSVPEVERRRKAAEADAKANEIAYEGEAAHLAQVAQLDFRAGTRARRGRGDPSPGNPAGARRRAPLGGRTGVLVIRGAPPRAIARIDPLGLHLCVPAAGICRVHAAPSVGEGAPTRSLSTDPGVVRVGID
jgi:hypothetical protein